MLVLGIETATPQVGVAIGGHEGVIASFHTARDRRHAETLAPAIQFLCAQTQLDLNDIGVVAVDIGPGLFTGLRVGLATAKAVAHACKVPMIGISSLDLAAFPARFSDRLIVSTVDARRGVDGGGGGGRVQGAVAGQLQLINPFIDQARGGSVRAQELGHREPELAQLAPGEVAPCQAQALH